MTLRKARIILVTLILSAAWTLCDTSVVDKENIHKLTVAVDVIPNAGKFEMISSQQSPLVSCYLKSSLFGNFSMDWEFCSSDSKHYGGENSIQTRRNLITLQLKRYPDPGTYCYRCIIKTINETIIYRSKEVSFRIVDNICGTLKRDEIISITNRRYICGFLRRPSKKCQRHTIEALKVIGRVNEIGETEVLLSWQKPKQYIDTVYGFHFKAKDLTPLYRNLPPKSACVMTKYGGEFDGKLTISEDESYTYYTILLDYVYDSPSSSNVFENILSRYHISIWSLPLSNKLTTTAVIRTRTELCKEFVQRNNGKIPNECLPFEDISVHDACLDDGVINTTSIRLTWLTRKEWFSERPGFNKTHIKIKIIPMFEIFLSVNVTSITIPLESRADYFYGAKIMFTRFTIYPYERSLTITNVYVPDCKDLDKGTKDNNNLARRNRKMKIRN